MAATNVKATFSTEAIMALPQNEPSICIPRVFPNITWQRVKEAFEKLEFGTIERVDMVNKTSPKGQAIKRVFIHFSKWNTENPKATEARRKMMEGGHLEFTYDKPWFWRCYKSNVPRPSRKNTRDTPKSRTPQKSQSKGKNWRDTKDKDTIKSLRNEIADLKKLVTTKMANTLGSHAPKKDMSKRPNKAESVKPMKLTYAEAASAPAPIAIPDETTAPTTPTPTPSSPAYVSPPVIERQTTTTTTTHDDEDKDIDWADMIDHNQPIPSTP